MSATSEDDQRGIPLLDDSDSATSARASTKRKAADKPSKRSAKRKKVSSAADDALDLDAGVNHAIAHMDAQIMADHIAQRTKRFQSDLSMVELDDLRIPPSTITDTSDYSASRKTDSLCTFLEHFAGKDTFLLSKASKTLGSPHTLVIAAAGLRAADLTRGLRKYQTKDSAVAKLFAKHIKLNEALESTKKTRMGIGVGTPQRLIDLIEQGALQTSNLQRVIVDASHIDQKKRGILDMRETHAPLVTLLKRPELMTRFEDETKRALLLFF